MEVPDYNALGPIFGRTSPGNPDAQTCLTRVGTPYAAHDVAEQRAETLQP